MADAGNCTKAQSKQSIVIYTHASKHVEDRFDPRVISIIGFITKRLLSSEVRNLMLRKVINDKLIGEQKLNLYIKCFVGNSMATSIHQDQKFSLNNHKL